MVEAPEIEKAREKSEVAETGGEDKKSEVEIGYSEGMGNCRN